MSISVPPPTIAANAGIMPRLPEICPEAELISGSMEEGECNAHHTSPGDSNPKAQRPSIDTGGGDLRMESVKSRKG